MMTTPPARAPLPRAAALCALSLALLAAACETPGPVNPSPVTVDRAYSASPGAGAQNRLTPREAMERYYPDVIDRGPGNEDQFAFVVSADGQVVEHVRGATTRTPQGQPRVEALNGLRTDPSRINSVDIIKMTPGQMGPGAVNIIFIQLKGEGEAAVASAAGSPARAGTLEGRRTTGAGATFQVRAADAGEAAAGQGSAVREISIVARGSGAGGAEASASANAAEARHEIIITGRGTMTTDGGQVSAAAREADAARVRAAVQRHLPRVAAEGTTSEYVWFVANTSGEVVSFGDNPAGMSGALSPADIESVQVFKGESVTINGHQIPVIWAVKKN